jgi:hypothetical protein
MKKKRVMAAAIVVSTVAGAKNTKTRSLVA